MKIYSFAPISACEYPTIKLLDHPYIWGGVQFCVNVSEKPYSPELIEAMAAHGIEWVHCPVSEDDSADWLESFATALPKMYRACKAGKKQVVHCDLGNNRSRAFVEALYFAVVRKEYADPYKGADNHLEYNCIQGHLPEIGEIERRIRAMIGVFPAWSMPEEEEQRRILLSPSPKWTIDSPTIQTKANPLERCHFELSGTPFLNLLYDAMEDFNNGRPVADGIVVDEVEMTIYDDWECVGRLSYGEGDKDIYKPLVSVKGETKKQRLNWDVEFEGFTPQQGHEYVIRIRRFYFENDPWTDYYFQFLDLISDVKHKG